MRYSKIEITGTPVQPFWYRSEETYQSSDLKQLGPPASKTKDGILFFITEAYHRFILIPENNAFFNIAVLKYGSPTDFSKKDNGSISNIVKYYNLYRLGYRETKLDDIFTDRYIKKLY